MNLDHTCNRGGDQSGAAFGRERADKARELDDAVRGLNPKVSGPELRLLGEQLFNSGADGAILRLGLRAFLSSREQATGGRRQEKQGEAAWHPELPETMREPGCAFGCGQTPSDHR